MKKKSYKILLCPEPEGGYTVIVKELPGCVTYGDTVEEAIEKAKEVIELFVDGPVEIRDAELSESSIKALKEIEKGEVKVYKLIDKTNRMK